ncbi:type ISP restriction/modification enzyme [Candidatus Synechococcus spongiarum]|uniref:type ISP restriction/modification enzyme n=1 Tax=Candidatus Synechococcus spongiarum TaxID=431041 RepID=UPI001377DCF5|nr:type ISP restriction/modification enzyme [Candidatus Synechococcus spongiarum]
MVDIYLNDIICWRGIPENIWNYVIGGYQVIKKWLSHREESILDRPLTKKEAREVTAMVRRLTTLVLLGDSLEPTTDHVETKPIAGQPIDHSFPGDVHIPG